MNRIMIMLGALVAVVWVWALFSDDTSQSAKTDIVAASMPAEGSTTRQPHPAAVASKSEDAAKSRRPLLSDVDPAVLRIALGLAQAEKRCESGSPKACAQLRSNDNAGALRLASMRRTLAKACNDPDGAACVQLGDLEREAGRKQEARRWYARARAYFERVDKHCRRKRDMHQQGCGEALRALDGLRTAESAL